ncbi:MAG: hypothetical protein GKR94_18350 [Gammaproteobacteria bacterium]|nr:hypothetical protein [Gammaproteobacteria bacterium]
MNEITLKLTIEEVNLILNALGEQPFAQVHQLVAKVQTQGSNQLQGGEVEPISEEKAKPD